MNIVKLTNKIALATVVLLMYWVFIFITSTVFGFKVFRENTTELFLFSILGLFAILSGSIVLNIMFNLTSIAEGRGASDAKISKSYKPWTFGFAGSLLVIFILLFVGDLATAKQKERFLVSSASDLIAEQKEIIARLADYSFSSEYIDKAAQKIKVLSKVEEKFPRVTVIVRDSLDNKSLLLGFTDYSKLDKEELPDKADYILSTSSEERQYLHSVFDGGVSAHRFSANDGQYEIYFPIKTPKGIIVLHLSHHSRYGKSGS